MTIFGEYEGYEVVSVGPLPSLTDVPLEEEETQGMPTQRGKDL